ncbi:MAG: hypothetical protein ACLUEQ_02730 [Cloacibacillus evryensis]
MNSRTTYMRAKIGGVEGAPLKRRRHKDGGSRAALEAA